MASMKKYGTPEKAEVFVGDEAKVINKHLAKTGKTLSEFSEEELEAFNEDLEKAREKASKKAEKTEE